jgi:ParB family chromosome partitioning protein
MPKSIQSIPLDQVFPDPDQPRKLFDEQQLQELANSIKLNGLIQPITVRLQQGRYLIVAGERRYRAHKLLDAEVIDAIVMESAENISVLQVLENLQRADLTPVELGHSYRALIDANGWSQAALAKQLGISKQQVCRALALVDAPEEIQSLVKERKLTAGHAAELVTLDSDMAITLANRAVAEGLNVKQLRAAVSQRSDDGTPEGVNDMVKTVSTEVTATGRELLLLNAAKAVAAMPSKKRDRDTIKAVIQLLEGCL